MSTTVRILKPNTRDQALSYACESIAQSRRDSQDKPGIRYVNVSTFHGLDFRMELVCQSRKHIEPEAVWLYVVSTNLEAAILERRLKLHLSIFRSEDIRLGPSPEIAPGGIAILTFEQVIEILEDAKSREILISRPLIVFVEPEASPSASGMVAALAINRVLDCTRDQHGRTNKDYLVVMIGIPIAVRDPWTMVISSDSPGFEVNSDSEANQVVSSRVHAITSSNREELSAFQVAASFPKRVLSFLTEKATTDFFSQIRTTESLEPGPVLVANTEVKYAIQRVFSHDQAVTCINPLDFGLLPFSGITGVLLGGCRPRRTMINSHPVEDHATYSHSELLIQVAYTSQKPDAPFTSRSPIVEDVCVEWKIAGDETMLFLFKLIRTMERLPAPDIPAFKCWRRCMEGKFVRHHWLTAPVIPGIEDSMVFHMIERLTYMGISDAGRLNKPVADRIAVLAQLFPDSFNVAHLIAQTHNVSPEMATTIITLGVIAYHPTHVCCDEGRDYSTEEFTETYNSITNGVYKPHINRGYLWIAAALLESIHREGALEDGKGVYYFRSTEESKLGILYEEGRKVMSKIKAVHDVLGLPVAPRTILSYSDVDMIEDRLFKAFLDKILILHDKGQSSYHPMSHQSFVPFPGIWPREMTFADNGLGIAFALYFYKGNGCELFAQKLTWLTRRTLDIIIEEDTLLEMI